jgi:hypothetical protein
MATRIKLILIFVIAFAYNTNGQGFRNYSWGSPKSKIVEEDGKPNIIEEHGIAYKNLPVAGVYSEHLTFFYFDDASLFRMGGYTFKLKTEKEKDILFDKMVKLYGQPKKVTLNIFWPGKIGFQDEYHYVWQTKDSVITLWSEGIPPPNLVYVIKYYEGPFFQKLYKKSITGL